MIEEYLETISCCAGGVHIYGVAYDQNERAPYDEYLLKIDLDNRERVIINSEDILYNKPTQEDIDDIIKSHTMFGIGKDLRNKDKLPPYYKNKLNYPWEDKS